MDGRRSLMPSWDREYWRAPWVSRPSGRMVIIEVWTMNGDTSHDKDLDQIFDSLEAKGMIERRTTDGELSFRLTEQARPLLGLHDDSRSVEWGTLLNPV